MSIKTVIALTLDVIAAPFRTKSVTAIVGQMEKQVGELFKVASANMDKADKLRDRAAELDLQATSHEDEADRALRVAERFTALIR